MVSLFITGGTGFIGSHLIRSIANRNYKIRALVRKNSNTSFIDELGIEKVIGDITDLRTFQDSLKGIDVVLHLAGVVTDWAPRSKYEAVHVRGMSNILKACKHNSIERIIYLSTLDVVEKRRDKHGKCVLTDDLPYNKSQIPYIDTKVRAEKMLFKEAMGTGLKVTAIRPVWVYGRGDNIFIPEILKNMMSRTMVYIGNPDRHLSLLHVENLANTLISCINNPRTIGHAILLCDGEKDWGWLLDKISKFSGAPRVKTIIPYRLAFILAEVNEFIWKLFRISKRPVITKAMVEMLGEDTVAVPKKAQEILSYKPKINIEEGIEDTIKSILIEYKKDKLN